MIATVYTPNGIVVATLSFDSFYEQIESEEGMLLSPIKVEGLPHTYTFWGKFSLTFNCLNNYSFETTIPSKFDELLKKWDSIPKITEFMPYLKKLIVDYHIQMIGVLAAYDFDKDNTVVPYVYQILGENIRRVNVDDEGNIIYNCVCLEKSPHIGKLLQQIRMRNGDLWEEYPAIRLRCDLYSLQKSIDLCRFMLRTNHYAENINSASYECPLKADISIVTKDKIETSLIDF